MQNEQPQQSVQVNLNNGIPLSPLDKYILYNKFPWKLILHILLIICTTYQVMSVINQRTAHNRAQHFVLKKVLLDSEEDSDVSQFYSLVDFQESLQTTMTNLRTLNDIVIQQMDLSEATYALNIYYHKFSVTNAKQSTYPIDIDKGIIDPFNLEDINQVKEFIAKTAKIEFIGSKLYNYVQFPDLRKDTTCLSWSFTISYNFAKMGIIETTIKSTCRNCPSARSQQGGQTFLFVHLVVLLLGSISLYITIVQLIQYGAVYLHHMEMKAQISNLMESQPLMEDQTQQSHQASPFIGDDLMQSTNLQDWSEVKAELFHIWFYICGIGGFFQVVGATIAVLDIMVDSDLSIFNMQEVMMGLGCYFAWILLLKYLEYLENINMMTGTLKGSSRNILMFLIGIIPFFFGFVFLAQSLFWRFDLFKSSLDSVTSLFSLANGDIVLDTFTSTWPQGVLGQLYIIVFMILFFTAVQNVLVTIIMEGYEQNRLKKNNQNIEQLQMIEKINEQLEQKDKEEIDNRDIEAMENDDDKEMVIGKMKLNMKRADRMIEELELLTAEIENSHVKHAEKVYLLHILRENVDNISRNIKFQISNMES